MTTKKDIKKEILVESFEVLKENIYKNSSELGDVIVKLSELDFEMALEMWRYLLKEFKQLTEYGNETYHLASSVVNGLQRTMGIEKIAKLMLEDEFIRLSVYNKSASPDYHVPGYFIDTNNLANANLILNEVYTNPNHTNPYNKDPFGEYLDHTIHVYCENIHEEGVSFLLDWAEKVSVECKAKIRLKLVDYM